ncbi:MAG: hypothetical protein EPO23_06615 [Xanthobacteraceae bacterium]|nr:MAG: hypothetical protein EPO23_06615 [Xanthobacteraceae bacterium]
MTNSNSNTAKTAYTQTAISPPSHKLLADAMFEMISDKASSDWEASTITVTFQPMGRSPSSDRISQDLRLIYNVVAKACHSHPNPKKQTSPVIFFWPDLPGVLERQGTSSARTSSISHIDRLDRFGVHYHGVILVPSTRSQKFRQSLLSPHGVEFEGRLHSFVGKKLKQVVPLLTNLLIEPPRNLGGWLSYAAKSQRRSELEEKDFLIFSMLEPLPSSIRRRAQVRRRRRNQRH